MDDDQQFCLRWNNHQSTLISVFDTLLENGTLVDCTLAAEGKFLKAHKVVLSACSPYFASLLSQQYDKHPIFILKDVKFQELRAMMDYMYRGEVNISQDQLAALLKAAESLQIKGLSDSRGGGSSATPAQAQHLKSDSVKSHVPAPKASGLTIENKRPLLRTLGNDFDVDVSASREGSVSPNTRKRKKINAARRKSNTESNSLLENDQHSNSSSHSLANNQPISNNTSATSATAPNLLSVVTKKTETQQQQHQVDKITDQQLDNEDSADDDDEDMNESNEQQVAKRTKHDDTVNKHDADHLLEPKNEYDDDNENVEDLTLDDEELLDDLDQAGPSHGGEGSSQGYHWQLDGRSQDEALMAAQEAAGQHRDAQGERRSYGNKKMAKSMNTTTYVLNDCLLESENIQITKKDNKYLLQPTVKADNMQKFVLKECELVPVINKRPVIKKVEKIANVSINKVNEQHHQQQIIVQQQIQIPAPLEKKIVKAHPRIKYSRMKNTAYVNHPHLPPPLQPRQIETKTEFIQVEVKAPKSNSTNNQYIIQQVTPSQSQAANNTTVYDVTTSNTTAGNDFAPEMDDLDYSGIDDIELPDDVQIHFSNDDSFKNEESNTSGGKQKYQYSLSEHSINNESDGEGGDGKQYACHSCGKKYRWKSTLRRHENAECGGKEASHQCPYCTYKAKQRGNLGVHIRKHHTDQPPLLTRRKSSKHMQ